MENFRVYLTERMSQEEKDLVAGILSLLQKQLKLKKFGSVGETGQKENKDIKNVQIRVAPPEPVDQNTKLEIASDIKKLLSKSKFSKFLKSLKVNAQSPNSSKFPSVSFNVITSKLSESKEELKLYDIVIGNATNKGEQAEKSLIQTVKDYHGLGKFDAYLEELEAKMEAEQVGFVADNVLHDAPELGKNPSRTSREGIPPDQLGAVIGDIIFPMEDLSPEKFYYVSVKNKDGATFANLTVGVSETFTQTTSPNGYPIIRVDTSTKYGKLLKQVGFDIQKIEAGFEAYFTKDEIPDRIEYPKGNDSSEILHNLMLSGWGWNYFYVREFKPGFKVKWLSKDLVTNVLTRDLVVTRLIYPYKKSKQVAFDFGNDEAKYSLEFRNKKGGFKPNEMQIILKSSSFAK